MCYDSYSLTDLLRDLFALRAHVRELLDQPHDVNDLSLQSLQRLLVVLRLHEALERLRIVQSVLLVRSIRYF